MQTRGESFGSGRQRAGRRRSVLGGAILAAAAVVAAVTAPMASAQTPKAGGSFTYLKGGTTPVNWDPVATGNTGQDASTGTAAYLSAVFGALAIEDYKTGKVVPSMASSIVATDAMHWTVNLRPNVKFTDGTAYDAAAVKFNWERHADRKNKSPQLAVVAAIGSMTVASPTALKVTLKAPDTQFDRAIARRLAYIGSPKAIKADVAKFRNNPVGAGPFVLDSYVANQTATFNRNPKYWDSPRPYLSKLTIRTMADNQQRYNTLAAGGGELEQILTGYSNVARARQDGFRVISNQPGGGGIGFMMNHTRAPFTDEAARRALRYMLNTGGEANTVDVGVTKPMRNMFPSTSAYYDASKAIAGYSAVNAQRALDEYASRTGKDLTFAISVADVSRATAEYYQAQLKEFDHLKVRIDVIGAQNFVGTLVRGAFDIAFFPYSFGDPIGETKLMLGTGGSKNFGKYSNPNLDKLLASATGAISLADRAKIFKVVQQLIIDDNPFIFTKQSPELQVVKKNVQGLDYAITGIPLWDRIWLS